MVSIHMTGTIGPPNRAGPDRFFPVLRPRGLAQAPLACAGQDGDGGHVNWLQERVQDVTRSSRRLRRFWRVVSG